METRWFQFASGMPPSPPRLPGQGPPPTDVLPPGFPTYPQPPMGNSAGGGQDDDFPPAPPLPTIPTLPTIPGMDMLIESWITSDGTWNQVRLHLCPCLFPSVNLLL